MQNKTHCTLLISCKESIMSAQHQKQQQKREKNKIRVKANLIITMFACVSIQHKSWTFLFATFKSIALCSQICVIISFISTNPILQVNAYTNWNWTQNMKKKWIETNVFDAVVSYSLSCECIPLSASKKNCNLPENGIDHVSDHFSVSYSSFRISWYVLNNSFFFFTSFQLKWTCANNFMFSFKSSNGDIRWCTACDHLEILNLNRILEVKKINTFRMRYSI